MKLNVPSMQDLLEAGVHFGHQVRRGHPKMRDYIFGAREGIHIINLEYSEKMLQEAIEYANSLGKEGKVILFVGTKKQAQPLIEEAAKKTNSPYVTYKWTGGLLTNFSEIRKNIKKLLDLEEKKQKGELTKYTKKEQLLITRKLEKFNKESGGIAQMDKLPDVLFIIDCVAERTALAEANRMNIPTIGLADTNCDPSQLTYPIPSNDDATKAIKIVLEAVVAAYEEGLKIGKAASTDKQGEKVEEKDKKGANSEALEEVSPEIAAVEEQVEKEVVQESERVV